MCLRKQSLSIEEGESLSKEDVIRVAAAREEIRRRVSNVRLDEVVVGRKMIEGREDNMRESSYATEYGLLLKSKSPLPSYIYKIFDTNQHYLSILQTPPSVK